MAIPKSIAPSHPYLTPAGIGFKYIRLFRGLLSGLGDRKAHPMLEAHARCLAGGNGHA